MSNTASEQPVNRRKAMLSPINLISLILIAAGLVIFILRYVWGLGGVTALDNKNPWGLWISFDLLCGIALAAGGYMTACTVCLFGMKQYSSALRPAIATAFLGYLFEVAALLADVGQPWRLPYPIFVSPGTTSIMYLVGLCVFIYLLISFVQWLPQMAEGLNRNWLKKLAFWIQKLMIPLVILGAVVAIIHQASLGALYLIAPAKIHPLWYSSNLPIFFLVSSIFAGLAMVICEGSLVQTSKKLHACMDATHLNQAPGIILDFGRAAGFIMLAYFLIRIFDLALQNNWAYLRDGHGTLYLIEMLGFVLLPCLLFWLGGRRKNIPIIRLAAVLTVLGIILNRFIISLVAYNWLLPETERYFPNWMEIIFSISMLAMIVTLYRLFAFCLPMLRNNPK